MGLRTEEITYNVHDRGRQALGQDRRYDLDLLAKVINSPATQERVKSGDMLGYYGHWPRRVFGMAMCEGGIVNGKVFNAAEVNTLADLPSREQLIARLLGSMMSPISGLAVALDQIAKKRSEGAAE